MDGFAGQDRTIYNVSKFAMLCVDANPNIIELLFVSESNLICSSRAWDMLLEKKDLFLSKKVKYTFTGYAMSQLNTIKRQRGWFLNPPKKKPERKDYRLDESTESGSVVEILTAVPVHAWP